MRNPAWNDDELNAHMIAYALMATMEANGQKFNKSQIRRELIAGPLSARSNGSLEAKWMNATAAANDLGLPTVKGYKAAPNYQKAMKPALQAAFALVSDAIDTHNVSITEVA